MIRFFGYNKCQTCRQAKKWLETYDIVYEDFDIISQPPTKTVLQQALRNNRYELKALFNRSGQLYRSMDMKNKLPSLSNAEAVALLSEHGKLIKRPVVVSADKITIGFNEKVFEETWLNKS